MLSAQLRQMLDKEGVSKMMQASITAVTDTPTVDKIRRAQNKYAAAVQGWEDEAATRLATPRRVITRAEKMRKVVDQYYSVTKGSNLDVAALSIEQLEQAIEEATLSKTTNGENLEGCAVPDSFLVEARSQLQAAKDHKEKLEREKAKLQLDLTTAKETQEAQAARLQSARDKRQLSADRHKTKESDLERRLREALENGSNERRLPRRRRRRG